MLFLRIWGEVTEQEIVVLEPLEPFSAASIDSEDGLIDQYRLDTTLPSLPPGAVENISVDFKINKKVMNPEGAFRLRIHTAVRYYDFPFGIRLELVDDKKIPKEFLSPQSIE